MASLTPLDPRSLTVKKGSAILYYAFDVAAGIDIEKADRLISLEKKKMPVREKKKVAKYFEFTPAPIRVIQNLQPIDVGGGFETIPSAEILIFDFGSISVRFQIPLQGEVDKIIRLSEGLYENEKLSQTARSLVRLLLEEIRPAVDRLDFADRVEDYCIFHLSEVDPPVTPQELMSEHIVPITCILRAETDSPSDREIQEILSERISYGLNDVTFMSWYGSVVYGDNAEDIYSVLEFANLVLMELSHLDDKLDRSLDEFYDDFTRQQKHPILRWHLPSKRNQLRKISRLQIDAAISFEKVTNALKLLGDDFQARVFQTATKKLGLAYWDAGISRKLKAIESIYDKISDARASRRMEVLEWIIIILFAISILLPFFSGISH